MCISIDLLDHTYYTAYKDNKGIYIEGDEIEVVNGSTGKYLRTDGNDIEKDNLGDLPIY